MDKIKIGLFGFGTVGKGLYDVLQKSGSIHATIEKICIRDPNKPRQADPGLFTREKTQLLYDKNINVIVELIDDAEAAFEIVKIAMEQGKSVVSANKKMIAERFRELKELQSRYKVSFLYEAACCAGIPIIRNLEEYYDTDLLQAVSGIINGSTNFILTCMEKGLNFKEALLMAQQEGFAEADATLDVEGHDSVNKLCILTAHAFGRITQPSEILFTGIQSIKKEDISVAKSRGLKIRLIAKAIAIESKTIACFVLPQFVNRQDDLYQVKNEFNAIITEGVFADRHFFKGKGAGAYPTAAAVLSDLAALRHNYAYEYKKIIDSSPSISLDYKLRVSISADKPELILKEDFETIECWHNEKNYSSITGLISAKKLFLNTWWKKTGLSLIIEPGEPIYVDNYNQIALKSLQLAGIERIKDVIVGSFVE